MTDPRAPLERRDPHEGTPDVGGPDAAQRNAASEMEAAEEAAARSDDENPAADADDLEADNPVEEDTLETVDPDNAPA